MDELLDNRFYKQFVPMLKQFDGKKKLLHKAILELNTAPTHSEHLSTTLEFVCLNILHKNESGNKTLTESLK